MERIGEYGYVPKPDSTLMLVVHVSSSALIDGLLLEYSTFRIVTTMKRVMQ
jgi:hypothetical protein